jgi:hypothetical protein
VQVRFSVAGRPMPFEPPEGAHWISPGASAPGTIAQKHSEPRRGGRNRGGRAARRAAAGLAPLAIQAARFGGWEFLRVHFPALARLSFPTFVRMARGGQGRPLRGLGSLIA